MRVNVTVGFFCNIYMSLAGNSSYLFKLIKVIKITLKSPTSLGHKTDLLCGELERSVKLDRENYCLGSQI